MANFFSRCDSFSSIIVSVTIPITVPASIIQKLEDDDTVSVWLRSAVLVQHYVTLASLICICILLATMNTRHERRVQQFVIQYCFTEVGLFTLDAILFWTTMSLSFVNEHSEIIMPLLISRCFQTVVIQIIAEILDSDVFMAGVKYHQWLVFTIVLMFSPVLCKLEIDKFISKSKFGTDVLHSLISLHMNVTKGILLTAIWLCFCSADIINDMVQSRRRSRMKAFASEAIFFPSAIFWSIFFIAVLCLRLPEVWQILIILSVIHTATLIVLKEVVQLKLAQIASAPELPTNIPVEEAANPIQLRNVAITLSEPRPIVPPTEGDENNLVVNAPIRPFSPTEQRAMEQIANDETEFNLELDRDEKEFWRWVESRHPDVFREFRKREEIKREKILAYRRKQEENLMRMFSGMNNNATFGNEPSDEDNLESADEITEDNNT